MSYFDNIVFDENTLLEGEQAEAYKAKKAAEKEAREKAEKELQDNANRRIEKSVAQNINSNEKLKSFDKARKMIDRERASRSDKIRGKDYNDDTKKAYNQHSNMYKSIMSNYDATARHFRRHSQNETAEMLEAYNPEFIEL